jgi:DNA-binding response OmpR family regulator
MVTETLMATDNRAGLAVAKRESPDLTLIDRQMSIKNGDERFVSEPKGFIASELRAH